MKHKMPTLRPLVGLAFTLILFMSQGVLHASPLTKPLENTQLPNTGWTWENPQKDETNTKIMYPKKTGQAVNLRVHTYEVPVTAKSFLEQVRTNIMEKPDYQGAEIRLVTTKEVDGVSWDVFEIKRKDEINQEIWGRKTDSSVVLMLIYTGAGDYFKEYYSDLMTVLKRASKI
jgi:hypothetical protein